MKTIRMHVPAMKASTSGRGLWTASRVETTITQIDAEAIDPKDPFPAMGLFVHIQAKTLSGYVYTDPQWIRQFRAACRAYGLNPLCHYSEQGMQSSRCVHLNWTGSRASYLRFIEQCSKLSKRRRSRKA